MKRVNTEWVKRLSALLLLAVLLFIQVGKALHAHTDPDKADCSESVQLVKKSADCAVCDYYFSKDADTETAFVYLQGLKSYPVYRCFFKSFLTASIGLSYADRGPPAPTC